MVSGCPTQKPLSSHHIRKFKRGGGGGGEKKKKNVKIIKKKRRGGGGGGGIDKREQICGQTISKHVIGLESV